MGLYDPAQDFGDSKDIPCNNWLSWLNRDGLLHLNVAIRSNDAIRGFSGINAFEWSVLLSMMAHWLGLRVGTLTFFASSFHVYETDFKLADDVVKAYPGFTAYDFGVPIPSFQTPWGEFHRALKLWFKAEKELRTAADPSLTTIKKLDDPFFQSTLRLIRLKWGLRNGSWSDDRLRDELHDLPEDDFAAAAYELYGRKRPEMLVDIPQPRIAAYFRALQGGETAFAAVRLKNAIKHLHARKNKAYGAAWKRRGERISILPNIARKVDRLDVFASRGETLSDEPVLDTVVDLFVYATKYRLFLAEKHSSLIERAVKQPAPTPFSDYDANFDALVDASECGSAAPADLKAKIVEMVRVFEQLCACVEADGTPEEKLSFAEQLCQSAETVITQVSRQHPAEVEQFVRAEIGIGRSEEA